jgi:hypothetical protein
MEDFHQGGNRGAKLEQEISRVLLNTIKDLSFLLIKLKRVVWLTIGKPAKTGTNAPMFGVSSVG